MYFFTQEYVKKRGSICNFSHKNMLKKEGAYVILIFHTRICKKKREIYVPLVCAKIL